MESFTNMGTINSFKIIGIGIESTNENGQAAEDLENLWSRFYAENVLAQIPNKLSEDIYAIYTDYESDYTGKYTCIIGQKVDSIAKFPAGLIGREFKSGTYRKIIAKGPMPNAIVDAWKEIWDKDEELNRSYTADFEVYSQKSQNGDNSEVEIYIATE